MNVYPVGSQVICRFAFTSRALNPAELAAFIASSLLPSGIGIAPDLLYFDYEPPNGDAPTVLTGDSISTDHVGAYHAVLPITLSGLWHYRGRGTDSDGTPVACTPDQAIRAVRTF